MDILVVTGGIGSGKSEVCRILSQMYGCGIYKADDCVKELYGRDPELVSRIEAALNVSLRDDEGRFQPSVLAGIIFRNRTALEQVENLVFPALMDDFHRWAEAYAEDRFVVFESATIMEKPQFKGFADKVILVDAPFDERLSRACARDSASRESVYARMQNQALMNMVSSGDVKPEDDAVINNYGSIADLVLQTKETIEKLYNR